jgi:predicted nucleotidyltransferase
MNPFLPEQVDALRELRTVMGSTPWCLIGASALRCHLDDIGTFTEDLDLAAHLNVDDLAPVLSALTNWKRDTRHEHRWRTAADVKVDVVPASHEAIARRVLVWPDSGAEMNLTGFRLIHTHKREMDVGGGCIVPVLHVEPIFLLKVVSYLDRPAERVKDLIHLVHMLEYSVPADDQRRFADDVFETNLPHERVGAYVLGRALGAILDEPERQLLSQFMAKVRDDSDRHGTQAHMARSGPRIWDSDPAEVVKRIDALELGIARASR